MRPHPLQADGAIVPHDAWMAAMRAGDFAQAWSISDACLAERLARGVPRHTGPRHLQHIWSGEPLADKRVLVRCYHGLGDTVQFIRFAAPLRKIAREVIVWAQKPLTRLIATASGVDRVLPLHDGTPEVDFDTDVEIMELPHALRVDASAIATAVPYLWPEPCTHQLSRTGNELMIGLVWRAGEWEPKRSVPYALLSRVSTVPGVRLVSLQCGPASAHAPSIPAEDINSENVEETAAKLRSLDVLISVDTFAAHLAGALGVPVWLLLNAECDWRWMTDRTDSVWYPTMRLFRTSAPGQWPQVIDSVVAALQALRRHRVGYQSFGTNNLI